MFDGVLPETVSARQLAAERTVLEGTIPLSRFARLVATLASEEGKVEARFSFSFNRDQQLVIATEGNYQVVLTCRHCLQPVTVDGEVAVSQLLVADEAALLALPEAEEAMIGSDKALRLVDVLEDEVLLALPMAPGHIDCDGQVASAAGNDEDLPAPTDTRRPFANLAEMMRTPDEASDKPDKEGN